MRWDRLPSEKACSRAATSFSAEQLVDVHGQGPEEPVLALEFEACAEVARAGSLHHAVDFVLGRDFRGPVAPFDDGAGTLPGRVEHGRGHQREDASSDRDLRAVRRAHRREHALLVGRVPVEDVHARAQDLARLEVGQGLAQVRLGRQQHAFDRLVHEHDLVVGIGDHHAVGHRFQGRLDPAVALGVLARRGERGTHVGECMGQRRQLAAQGEGG